MWKKETKNPLSISPPRFFTIDNDFLAIPRYSPRRTRRDFHPIPADNAHLTSMRISTYIRIPAGFADRETVIHPVRDVEIVARIAQDERRVQKSAVMLRLVSSGSAYNRHYRLFPAITCDDNTRCGSLV